MNPNDHRILCIEDDKDTCDLLTFIFQQEGFKVESCSKIDCLNLLHEEKFSAVILDNYFIETSGVNICRELRSFDKTTPVIFFSGETRKSEIEQALEAGANTYLVKPNDFEKLVPTTLELIKKSHVS
jgi:DNA-binding response OmpR family regulator